MNESPIVSPIQIVESIRSTWEAMMLREAEPPRKAPYVYASGWTPCTRQMVYEMIDGDKRPEWSANQLANFERGEDREITLLHKLGRVGQFNDPPFRVIGQQERFELKDRKGRVAIVGKTDASFDFGHGYKAKLEVKSWSQNITQGLHSFEDLLTGKWTQRGAYQILAYLLGAGEPIGFIMLDRPGIPTIIPVELDKHLDLIEGFLQQAEVGLNHKLAGTMPGFIDDLSVCRRCWCFQLLCDPPTSSDMATILADEELEASLSRREELRDAHEEYAAIDKDVKEQLRGVETGICGPFSIEGKWGKNTTYKVPAEIKEQYKDVDPNGKFTLKITKM